jgi:hypothetical protein
MLPTFLPDFSDPCQKIINALFFRPKISLQLFNTLNWFDALLSSHLSYACVGALLLLFFRYFAHSLFTSKTLFTLTPFISSPKLKF